MQANTTIVHNVTMRQNGRFDSGSESSRKCIISTSPSLVLKMIPDLPDDKLLPA